MDLHAPGKAGGEKIVYGLFESKYYRPNKKCLTDKLLMNKSDGDKVLSLPIAQSSFDSWINPLFNVALFVLLFQGVDSVGKF